MIAPPKRLLALGALLAVATFFLFGASGDAPLRRLGRVDLHSKLSHSDSGCPFPFRESAPASSEERAAASLVSSIAEFKLLNTRASSNRLNVSLCAVATHEEDFLVEWIVWHRLLGVERMYLFDNMPTTRMRRLLRPFLEEGSVVLYELNYPDDVLIGAHHRADLLRLCEREVLLTSRWAAHLDVDEFLVLHSPDQKSHVPERMASASPPEPSVAAESSTERWSYPLHRLLTKDLEQATCVPVPRITFANVGVRELGPEYVTERHVTREKKEPGRSTWGKLFLQWPDTSLPRPASWWGPHSCQPTNGDEPEANVIMDVKGTLLTPLHSIYPMKGLPLPDEGLGINHYAQRSLANCLAKAEVVKDVHTDWRAIEGPVGCALHYMPMEDELEDARSQQIMEKEIYGKDLLERPAELVDGSVIDTVARDSWEGRMTRAILDRWRMQSGTLSWPWEHKKWKWPESDVASIGIRVRQGGS